MDKKRLKISDGSDVLDCFDHWEEEDDSSCSESDHSDIDQDYEPDVDRNKD